MWLNVCERAKARFGGSRPYSETPGFKLGRRSGEGRLGLEHESRAHLESIWPRAVTYVTISTCSSVIGRRRKQPHQRETGDRGRRCVDAGLVASPSPVPETSGVVKRRAAVALGVCCSLWLLGSATKPVGARGTAPPRNGQIAVLVDNYLKVIGPDGSGLRTLTGSGGPTRKPCVFESCIIAAYAWSPDGRRLAFIRGDAGRGGGCQKNCRPPKLSLFVINANGGGERRLADCDTDCGAGYVTGAAGLAWSPDDARIAFFPGGLTVVNVRSGQIRHLAPAGNGPAWSPDGKTIAYATGAWLFTVNSTGIPAPTPLLQLSNVHENAGTLNWAPDSRSIVFDDPDGIYTVRADGSHLASLVSQAHGNGPGVPSFSPDGKHILYFNTPGVPGGFRAEVWVMKASGAEQTRVSQPAMLRRRLVQPDLVTRRQTDRVRRRCRAGAKRHLCDERRRNRPSKTAANTDRNQLAINPVKRHIRARAVLIVSGPFATTSCALAGGSGDGSVARRLVVSKSDASLLFPGYVVPWHFRPCGMPTVAGGVVTATANGRWGGVHYGLWSTATVVSTQAGADRLYDRGITSLPTCLHAGLGQESGVGRLLRQSRAPSKRELRMRRGSSLSSLSSRGGDTPSLRSTLIGHQHDRSDRLGKILARSGGPGGHA